MVVPVVIFLGLVGAETSLGKACSFVSKLLEFHDSNLRNIP